MHTLGGDQREALAEVKAHLTTENASGPRSGAVGFVRAVGQNVAQEVFIGRWDAHASSLMERGLPPGRAGVSVVERFELLYGHDFALTPVRHMADDHFPRREIRV